VTRGAPKVDPVSPALRQYVFRRDQRCIIATLVRRHIIADRGPCRDRFGHLARAEDPAAGTAAHVRDSAGGRTGRRPRSIPRRLVWCCWGHHVLDSVVDRADVRPLVDAYLEEKEGPDLDEDRPWEVVRRVRARGVSSATSEPEGGSHGA
jgi:hypothetical protein